MFERRAVSRVRERINRHQNLRAIRAECAYKQWNLHIDRQIVNLFLLHGYRRGKLLYRQTTQLGRVSKLHGAAEVVRLNIDIVFRIDRIALRVKLDYSAALSDVLRIDREKTELVLTPRAAVPFITLDFNSVCVRVIAGKIVLYGHVNLRCIRFLLHRRDGNGIIRRLCFCLSAPAQYPHKSQCR